jgi:hypothetical protein
MKQSGEQYFALNVFLQLDFLEVAAEQRVTEVTGRVVGVEITGSVG